MAEKYDTNVMTGNDKKQQSDTQSQGGRQAPEMERSRRGSEGSTGMRRGDQAFLMSPFALLQRLADSVTGIFDDDTFFGGREMARRSREQSGMSMGFTPRVDMFQRGNDLIVRVDLPGMRASDVSVEVSDDTITISGERSQDRQEERGGVYRYERSYGSFYRAIPLPEGAISDQAKARFENGVLEIVVPAPPEQVSRGRRLEISEGGSAQENQPRTEGQSR